MKGDSTISKVAHPSVKGYLVVFVALAALTIITVAVSYLEMSLVQGVVAALCIATIKGALVASYFMHLLSERKVIFAVLILTVVFLAVLFGLPFLTLLEQGKAVDVP